MKQRSPIAVFFLGLITLGIYSWYWAVKTKTEMNSMGNNIPTAWIWLIPYVGGIWWSWKYSEAVEKVTGGKTNGVVAFLLLILLGFIGEAIIQDAFNQVTPVTGAPADMPAVPAVPATPEATQSESEPQTNPNPPQPPNLVQ